MATLTAEDGGNVMIKEAIIKLSKKEDLSYEMAQTVMDEIMTGEMCIRDRDICTKMEFFVTAW